MTQQLAYLAQQHFCAIPQHSGIRTDYRPGDIVADFEQWPEHARSLHLERGMVRMALSEGFTVPAPTPAGQSADPANPERFDQVAQPRLNRIMPDRSLTDDVRQPIPSELADGPWVPWDQQKSIRLDPQQESEALLQRRAAEHAARVARARATDPKAARMEADERQELVREGKQSLDASGSYDSTHEAFKAAVAMTVEGEKELHQARKQRATATDSYGHPVDIREGDPETVSSQQEGIARANALVREHHMSEEAAAIAAGTAKPEPAAILPRASKAKAKK